MAGASHRLTLHVHGTLHVIITAVNLEGMDANSVKLWRHYLANNDDDENTKAGCCRVNTLENVDRVHDKSKSQ